MEIQFRPARRDDARLLWEWANEPQLRAASFCAQAIGWEEHLCWLDAKLVSAHCLLLIAENLAREPIGQVRFDIEETEAIISLGLDAAQRGRGYGSAVVRLASQRLFDETQVHIIRAYLKPENEASRRAFEKAGYSAVGTMPYKDHPALNYVLQRP